MTEATEAALPTEPLLRSGFVAIVGRPNVGKSTLLNRLVGEKLSIVSRKAQTTRYPLLGILTENHCQYVFVDTPGFQRRFSNKMNQAMNRSVTSTLAGVDAVLFVVAANEWGHADEAVLALIDRDRPVILVVNKVDRLADKTRLLPYLQAMNERFEFAALTPISAEKNWQLDMLKATLAGYLPTTGLLYDETTLTDRDDRFFAAEFIREKLFRLLGDELPYKTAVNIEKIERAGSLRRFYAAILVEKDSHKAMLLGKGGQTMKRIASEARLDLERMLATRVYLEVWVKVRSGWSDSDRMLSELGFYGHEH